MCGIVGIFDTRDRRAISRDLVSRMNETQFHRGPDEGGLHTEPGLGLGHRRLSIIDLSSGQQPLFNEDESVVVVYNGEIYNFQELSDDLKGCGHRFRTHCDTEVIVHAWEEWGERCVERFRGMFAFALWDRNRSTLFLARDRLGIKPLYYALLPDGHLIFSSELKALLVHPDLARRPDPLAIEEYFAYGYVPEPRTILQQVSKLPPGHTLTLRKGEAPGEAAEYWDVPFAPLPAMDVASIQRELVERLKEAVEIRMIAEVPLGAFLSGGVDSSAVVALMAGLNGTPVNTCSISFGDPDFNEEPYAELVAQKYRTRHQVQSVDPEDFALVSRLSDLYDEPYADSSAIPTYRVCELARQRVTVALSGDGGDENFAGYRRYQWHLGDERLRSLMPYGVRRPVFNFLGRTYPALKTAPRFLRGKSTFQLLARGTLEGYLHRVALVSDPMRERLYSRTFKAELQGYRAVEVLRRHARKGPTHPLSLIQYLDMKTYLPGDILTKVDRASMAHALEVRVPILDHKLVEWISGLPPALKLRGREGKHVFKKALEPHLPADILYRPKKGFAVPLGAWFRGPLRQRVRDAILGPVMMDTGLFERRSLDKILDQHQSGIEDHSAKIWALLMYEAFVRRVLV